MVSLEFVLNIVTYFNHLLMNLNNCPFDFYYM